VWGTIHNYKTPLRGSMWESQRKSLVVSRKAQSGYDRHPSKCLENPVEATSPLRGFCLEGNKYG